MSCPYEIFISGETIDLVVPNQVAIDAGHWHRWFNDPETTRYLEQGLYPNTPDAQQAFLDTAMAPDSNRFVLLVWAKNVEKLAHIIHDYRRI